MRNAIFLVVLLAAATAVHAQAYKWKDADGRVQYSDMPPPPGAKDVQQLRKTTGASTPPATAPTAGAQPKAATDPDAEFRKRQLARQEADAKQAKAQEEEEVRMRHCEQAKTYLASIESGGRVTRYNAQGERVVLDDVDREPAKAEALKAIALWCK